MGNINKMPELRFSEFIQIWQDNGLGDLITHNGGTALENLVSEFGKYKFISIGNYSIDGKYIDTGQRIDKIGKASEKTLNKNDLVMVLNDKTAVGNIIGSTILIDEDNKYIYNQRSERIICNHNVAPSFLWHMLNTPMFRKKVFDISQGGTQIYVNFPMVKKLMVRIPILQEQIKIAALLSLFENKIEKQGVKIELLEVYKKGLMQKIFSQELRFKDEDGNEYQEWKDIILGEICKLQKGKQLNSIELKPYGLNNPFPALNGGINPSGYTHKPNSEGDIISISEGGNSCGYVNYNKIPFWSGGHNYTLIELKEYIDNKYLYHFLKKNEASIMAMRVGSGLPNIQRGDILEYGINLPCMFEQIKIANILSKFDEKIEKEKEKLDTLKELKKGLLQKMFV